jgi:phospholipid transport system substrate-binding protein
MSFAARRPAPLGPLFLAMALSWAWQSAWATAKDPQVLLQEVTTDLVTAIGEARSYYDSDPERFYGRVDGIIAPVVDFRGFSRAVMGKYGSTAYYRQLTSDAERRLFVDRVNRFTGAVKTRMIKTLSKGLMTFSGERIEVVPADAAAQALIDQQKPVSVTQLIYRKGDQPLEVNYKLHFDGKSAQWRMINLVMNNINLGKQYRTEFSSKLKEYQGDLDQVIDYWSEAEEDPAVGG